MQCPNCGTELHGEPKCPNCGAPITYQAQRPVTKGEKVIATSSVGCMAIGCGIPVLILLILLITSFWHV